jgi:hypothetical protein
MRSLLVATIVALTLTCAANAAATVTVYTDVTTFNAAVGPTTLEDFTNTFHDPISTGVLNSFTNLPGIGITPGTILPGVTYSATDVSGKPFFFNIDAGAGFTGGFLDTVTGDGPLTVTFDSPAAEFGYLTNGFGGTAQSVVIHFSDSTSQTFNYTEAANFNLSFIGFQSPSANITSFTLEGTGAVQNNPDLAFAIDNFQFGPVGGGATPEPGSLLLLGTGLVGLGRAIRRKSPQ